MLCVLDKENSNGAAVRINAIFFSLEKSILFQSCFAVASRRKAVQKIDRRIPRCAHGSNRFTAFGVALAPLESSWWRFSSKREGSLFVSCDKFDIHCGSTGLSGRHHSVWVCTVRSGSSSLKFLRLDCIASFAHTLLLLRSFALLRQYSLLVFCVFCVN